MYLFLRHYPLAYVHTTFALVCTYIIYIFKFVSLHFVPIACLCVGSNGFFLFAHSTLLIAVGAWLSFFSVSLTILLIPSIWRGYDYRIYIILLPLNPAI